MRLSDVTEIFFAALLLKWELTAPDDGKGGMLDGEKALNTQQERMARALRIIATGWEDKYFSKLAIKWRKNDGRSYISKDNTGMNRPIYINSGWWLDGCASLTDKQGMMQSFTQLGYTPTFVRCVNAFIAGESIKDFIPTDEEQEIIISKFRDSDI